MARRWILTAVLAAVLVVATVVAARAIRDDDTDPEAATRATTTTSAAATTSTTTSTTAVPTTIAAPTTTTTAPTSTTGPPGPCGADAGPIRVAIDAGVSGAAEADVAACRLAASDPSWAAVNLAAKPGAQFAALTVIVHGAAGSWSVVAQGGTDAGCAQVPQQVIVDLGQFCAGTGGGGVR